MNNDCIEMTILLRNWKNIVKLYMQNKYTQMLDRKYIWQLINHWRKRKNIMLKMKMIDGYI